MRVAILLALAGVVGTGVVGCGSSYPVPQDQFAAAQSDVGRAEQAGASNVPDARLHLQLAQEDLSTAKSLMNVENEHAASLIARASAEAVLAVDLATEQKAQAQAQAAADAVTKAKSTSNPAN